MPDLYESGPLDEPKALYVNCPTFVMGGGRDAPPGHATVATFAPCSYQACNRQGQAAGLVWRDKHAGMLIDLIDRRFAPGLKEKLGAIHLCTPDEKEPVLLAPEGNIYGRSVEAREVWTKIPFKGGAA